MKLSVVIPAYNEERRLPSSLLKLNDYMKRKGILGEIIVVDDGSTDNTADVAGKLGIRSLRIIRNGVNRGKGYSVKAGILEARYPLVLFSDSDLATPIEELDNFLKLLELGYDIIIASRNLKNSDIVVKQPFYRQLMGKLFPFLATLIAGVNFRDTQCGFKLFRTDAAKRMAAFQTFNRFSFDVELMFLAKKMGLKVKEAPVKWIDQRGSKVSPLKDGITMLLDLFRLRYNELAGKYDLGKNTLCGTIPEK